MKLFGGLSLEWPSDRAARRIDVRNPKPDSVLQKQQVGPIDRIPANKLRKLEAPKVRRSSGGLINTIFFAAFLHGLIGVFGELCLRRRISTRFPVANVHKM